MKEEYKRALLREIEQGYITHRSAYGSRWLATRAIPREVRTDALVDELAAWNDEREQRAFVAMGLNPGEIYPQQVYPGQVYPQ